MTLLLLVLLGAWVGAEELYWVAPSTDAEGLYPEYAHHHQVWLPSGANQSEIIDYVKEYLAHNISVGATNVDSNWATGFNSFVWRKDRFPDAGGMINTLHSLGVRVIAWATSMIDTDSPNFAFAKSNDYLISKGALMHWWHGNGGLLDFTYPAAMEYWKKLMDNVLVNETQLDGFKCDGTDPYILLLDLKGGAHGHDGKHISYREYADLYYGTFLNHSRARNPYAIVWSRPVDSFSNWLYMDFSPRYVTFSGWVGDQDPTFDGLVDAMNNMLRSAWANAVSFGSDTGGYRCCGSTDKKRGRTRELLLRWAQLNSLMGLFENGGDNEHRPWMFDSANVTTAIYRQFVDLHTSLAPYLLSTGSDRFERGLSIVAPVAPKPPLDLNPSTWAYFLGPSVFVDPVLQSNVSQHLIHFPKGHDYVDWFNKSVSYSGGSKLLYSVELESGRYPVFHVRGNLLPLLPKPLHNSRLLVPSPSDPLSVLLPCPRGGDAHSAAIRRYRMPSQRLSYSFSPDEKTLLFRCSAHPRALALRVTGLPALPVLATGSSGHHVRLALDPSDSSVSFHVNCTRGNEIKIIF